MPSSSPSVLIVILNYREPESTIAAVESVLAMDYPDFSVLVIDNGSKDDSAQKLAALQGGRVDVVALAENRGFTGGINVGFERALARNEGFVWMLNNDALVPPDTLSSLVQVAQSTPKVGLVSPLIATLGENPRITFAGGILDVKAGLYDETHDPAEAEAWRAKFPGRSLVVGTAMLVRTEMIREIGMLDERFFMYYDDMDYCARAQAAGYEILVDNAVTVYHHEKNKDTNPLGMKPHYWYYNARNSSRFWRKHMGLAGGARQMWQVFNRFLRHRNQVRADAVASQAILAGLWDGWMDRGGEYDPTARMPWPVTLVAELYSRRTALRP